MIPRPPSSSPSIQPVLRKATTSHRSDDLDVASLHCNRTSSTASTADLSSTSLHSCPEFDEKNVVLSRRPKIHHIMDLSEYTVQEIQDCWWDSEELMDIKKQCQVQAKAAMKQSAKSDLRGYECITDKARKRATVEMARETVLYDHCFMNYSLNSKVSLREAQDRARLDSSAVDHSELVVLMKELSIAQQPTVMATKKNRSKTNLFQEVSARMQRTVKTARGA
jgi:hypothetical protein